MKNYMILIFKFLNYIKKIFLFLFACIFFLNTMAINDEQAILVTQNFLKEKKIGRDISLSKVSIREMVKKEGVVVYYIMNIGDKEGFVIISASEYTPPIIGYSFTGEFQWQPAIQYYLDSYSNYLLHEKGSKSMPDAHVVKQWNYYLQEEFVSKTVIINEVPALITSQWNQDKYYNTYCPWDVRAGFWNDYRTYNGCVALAAAQLMNYYRHPETGRSGAIYKPINYPQQTVFFSHHQYHWDAMCDRATDYTNEIAKLAYHLGVAAFMNYGTSGSGAQTEDVAIALRDNFFYTDYDKWPGAPPHRLIPQLDLLQPILMHGVNEHEDGHAFLIDGYRETMLEDEIFETEFHFNWGWGGWDDGYYTLAEQEFLFSTDVFLDIVPATNYPVQCQYLKKQTAFEGYVTNGSTNKPYQSNPDCSWMIAAPGAKRYTFSFSRLDTQEDIDEITIYNGSEKSSGIAATFSGAVRPSQPVTIFADSVLITFTSKDETVENTTHRGFLMNYVTDKPQQKCNATTYLSAPSGYITDGTQPGENYVPWSDCTWTINSPYGAGFFGLFHEFDLRLGDFVDVFDATRGTPYLWRRFDRYSLPTIGEVISIPFSKIQIHFITDNFEEGNGFKFQYFSILGVNDHSLLDNLTIFPNPATEVVNLSFSSEMMNQSITCMLVDVMGKVVYTENIDYNGDVYATQIPVAHLAKGFYLLQLVTNTGIATSKIIVN